LNTENLEDIFEGFDENVTFSNFLNIYLKFFYACFTKSKLNSSHKYNTWINGELKYRFITKEFFADILGEIMSKVSNYDRKIL